MTQEICSEKVWSDFSSGEQLAAIAKIKESMKSLARLQLMK